MTRPEIERFRRRCRHAAWIIWALAGAAVALVALDPLLGLAVQDAEAEPGWLLTRLIRIAPHAAYLYALFALGAALSRIAAGGLFRPAIAAGLKHAGAALIAGGVYSIAVMTNLLRLTGAIEGGYLHFDVAGLALALTGAALALIAGLIARAERIEAELDEIV